MLSLIFYVSYIRAYDFEVDGIYYTVTSFDEFLVKVDGFGPSVSGIVNIPSTISYSDKVFTVTEIGSGQSNQITTVLIPPTITKIGGRAFYGSSISSIDIPDNVSDIGAFAFANCINLKSAKITKNISKLQESLFEGCTNLTQVEWHPSSSGKILGNVFWGCSSLRSFRIPAKVSSIGGPEYSAYASDRISAFQNCSSLDSLIIEDGTGAITVRDDHEAAGEQFDSGYHGEFYGSKINYVYMGRPIELYSWASYEPTEGDFHFDWLQNVMDELYSNGIYTILATPSGARPAWLDLKYPEVMRVDGMGHRNRHGLRHNHCMSSPIYREKIGIINNVCAVCQFLPGGGNIAKPHKVLFTPVILF